MDIGFRVFCNPSSLQKENLLQSGTVWVLVTNTQQNLHVFLFLQQAGGGGGQDGITKADLVTSLKVGGLSLCHP